MCVCTTDLTEEALTTLLPIEHHDHFLNNSSTPYLLYWFSVEGHVKNSDLELFHDSRRLAARSLCCESTTKQNQVNCTNGVIKVNFTHLQFVILQTRRH